MLKRVLIANRGEFARRLIRHYKSLGIETVSVFSEPDVDQPWVEEADYSVYLNGRSVRETYMDARRIVSAAMDSGSDAIHPGYCFLAERVDFFEMAMTANVAIIGNDPVAVARAVDRFEVRKAAKKLGIPVIPASDPLDPNEDGVAAGAQVGFPLYVKTPGGGVIRRVEQQIDLADVVKEVREIAVLVNGEETVYLERAVDSLRRCGTVVVADDHGEIAHFGVGDSSLQLDFRTWVEECGPSVTAPEAHERMGAAAVALAEAINWTGVGKVRWAVTPDGGWYLLGFSGRFTTGYDLVELLQGVDLVDTQFRIRTGEPLGWSQDDIQFDRHAVQVRIFPFNADDPDSIPEGVIEEMEIPVLDGVRVETGTCEGQPVNADTEPLLVKLSVTAPTRQAALVRAKAVMEQVRIKGIPTNQGLLSEALSDPVVWQGKHDVNTLTRLLKGV